MKQQILPSPITAPKQLPIVKVSDDGLVRLTMEQLQCLPLQHLLSGVDCERGDAVPMNAAQATDLAGYTEWFYENGSAITIGWDWHWHYLNGSMLCDAVHLPRSNIQLIEDGYDVSPSRNDELLLYYIAQLSWRRDTLSTICSQQSA